LHKYAEVDKVWSVSAYLGRNVSHHLVPKVSAWPTRFIALCLAIEYFGSGVWKSLIPEWHTGDQIRYTYANAWGTPVSIWFLSFDFPLWLYDILSLSVIVFEISIAFLLYSKRWKKPIMILGIFFHLHNCIFVNVPEFLFFPFVYLLFLEGEEVKRGGEYIYGKLRSIFGFLYVTKASRS